MGLKRKKNKRKGCFRRLSSKVRVIIICFHMLTLLVVAIVLALAIYTQKLQKELLVDLSHDHEGQNYSQDIEHSLYAAVAIRVLGILIGCYSVKTRHSPAIVMALTALVFMVCVIHLVAGISIFVKYDAIAWVRERLQSEMDEMEFDEPENVVIRKIQSEKKCCGIEEYKDWQLFPYGITSLRIPPSCCLPKIRVLNGTEDKYCGQNILPQSTDAGNYVYTRGCFLVITQKMIVVLNTTASICIIFGIIDLILAAFGVFLVLKDYV